MGPIPVILIIVAALTGDVTEGRRRRAERQDEGSSQVAAQLADFDCPEEFGYYPHPADCSQYYVCVFGGALLESCTGGLLYSHELQTCDWPRNVGCGSEAIAAPAPAREEVRVRAQPAQREPIRHRPVPKHDLYTEEEEVGPAEEVETDRQQRVYRGQPATIGQVQSDRDAISTHSNAIPVSSTGRENSKLSVVSYGPQHQYNRASLAPQSYEQATAAPARGYNTSQYVQYDPYYTQYEEPTIYKAIDDYSQYEQEYQSRGREKKPQLEIKYTPQQDVYVNQDYSYTVQNEDNVYNRQPVQKSYNRSGSSDNSGGGDSVQVAAELSPVGPSSRSPLDRNSDRTTTSNTEGRRPPVRIITGKTELRGLVAQTPRPFQRRGEGESVSLDEGFHRGLAINRLQAVSALEGVVYDFDARAGIQAEAEARAKAVRARLQEIENTARPQVERDGSRSPSTRPAWTETTRAPSTVRPVSSWSETETRNKAGRSRYQEVDSSARFNDVEAKAPSTPSWVEAEIRSKALRGRFQEDSTARKGLAETPTSRPSSPSWVEVEARSKALRSRLQEENTVRPTTSQATSKPRTLYEAFQIATRPTTSQTTTAPFRFIIKPNRNPAEAEITLVKTEQPKSPERTTEYVLRFPPESANQLEYTRGIERTTEYVLRYQPSIQRRPEVRAQPEAVLRSQQQARETTIGYQAPAITTMRYRDEPKFEEPVVQHPKDRTRYLTEEDEPSSDRVRDQVPAVQRLPISRYQPEEPVQRHREQAVPVQRTVPTRFQTEAEIQSAQRTRDPIPSVQRTAPVSYEEDEEEEEEVIVQRSRERIPPRTPANRYLSEADEQITLKNQEKIISSVQRTPASRYQSSPVAEEQLVQRTTQRSRDAVVRPRYQPEVEIRQPKKAIIDERPQTYRPTPKKYDGNTEYTPRYRDSSESEISRNRYTETDRPVEKHRTAADRQLDSYNLNNLQSKTIDTYTLNRPSYLKPKVELDSSYLNNSLSQIECTDCNENQVVRVKPATYDSQTTPGLTTRGSSRHRGGTTYTLSPNDAEPAPRGTPAVTRGRPTLKPSTSIVSKAAEYVDIYRFPPNRPEPIYPTPTPDKTAAKCRKDVCLLPDCYCGGKEVPGDLSVEQTPQIVLLTFDDSVNDLNKGLYSDLFEKGRTNPNGCPIAGTFYVSHEWTDYSHVQNLYSGGHEIASHSVSHSFGEQFSQKKWTREIAGQREILSAYGGVKLEDIRGMRAPFLAVGGNKMFKMLYDSNFTYDSSMPVYENRPPSWPYTLDYKIFHDCMIPPCPTKSYPGVWEVPMVMWQDLNGGRCSMGDACSNPPTSDGVYKMLIKNFERHFTSNRAPFGLYYHAAWFTQPHHKEGFIAFLDTITNMPEVWLVTNWQMIQWVRDPTPISRLNGFQPFQCNYQDRPKKCSSPKVCNLWHKSGVRYMRTCQACPEVYPWTGKTGVRNSRVDNQIFQD